MWCSRPGVFSLALSRSIFSSKGAAVSDSLSRSAVRLITTRCWKPISPASMAWTLSGISLTCSPTAIRSSTWPEFRWQLTRIQS